MKLKTKKAAATKTKRPGGQRNGGRRAMYPEAGRQVSLHCRVPRPMLQALEARAKLQHHSVGEIVRRALEGALQSYSDGEAMAEQRRLESEDISREQAQLEAAAGAQ
jgi:hypothetical protein